MPLQAHALNMIAVETKRYDLLRLYITISRVRAIWIIYVRISFYFLQQAQLYGETYLKLIERCFPFEARSYFIPFMYVCVLNVGCLTSVTNQTLHCAYRVYSQRA